MRIDPNKQLTPLIKPKFLLLAYLLLFTNHTERIKAHNADDVKKMRPGLIFLNPPADEPDIEHLK
jgi:hypothetical protein